jgi:hypothetical protein
MTQANHPQKEHSNNGESINGAMIKRLIMAGALWSKKHYPELARIDESPTTQIYPTLRQARREARSAATQINEILQEACYEVNKCPSNSIKAILIAASQGAQHAGAFHQGRPFFRWFMTLTRTLSDKQEISTQGFAQAMLEAANNMNRIPSRFTLKNDISSARRAAGAAMYAATTTQDIYTIIDKILEEIEKFLDEREETQKQTENEMMLIAMELTISTGRGLKFFFEGMKYYVKGYVSLIEIKRENDRYERLKTKISPFEKRPGNMADGMLEWLRNASILLEETIFDEIDDIKLHTDAKTVKNMILSNDLEVIYSMRSDIHDLLGNLVPDYAPKVYAPASNKLAGNIVFTILNDIKPRQGIIYLP